MPREEIKTIAEFTAALIVALEQREHIKQQMSWPEWFAAVHGIDLDNPPFADGRHLKAKV